MLLSEKPIEGIRVGDRVKSLVTGHLGYIVLIENQLQHPDSPHDVDNDYWITITWDTGHTSVQPHLWLDKVIDPMRAPMNDYWTYGNKPVNVVKNYPSKCAKCGFNDVTLKYDKVSDVLIVTCFTCGYVWSVEPVINERV